MRIRAAVVEGPGQAPEVIEADLGPPGPHEVVVRVEASGICHTDVAFAAGELWDRFPVVLGHEFCGVVTECGPDVERVAPGDRVIVFNRHCGHCRDCESGHSVLCHRIDDSPQRLTRDGPTPLVSQGGFSEAVVAAEEGLIAVPDGVPPTVAAILGCAVNTGLGSVFNVARLQPGSTAAVFGAGGVGLSVIMGARIAGAVRIVCIEPDGSRREFALRIGATDAIEPSSETIAYLAPEGFDYVFESVGRTEVMEMATDVTRRGGTTVIIGAPPLGARFGVDALDLVVNQRRILGSLRGDVKPDIDFARYFSLYLNGDLDLDAMVTRTIPLDDIAKGFKMSQAQDGIRTLITP